MFQFLERVVRKSPEEFIEHMVTELTVMKDHKRQRFIERNLPDLEQVMTNATFACSRFSELSLSETHSLNYLVLHGEILVALVGANDTAYNLPEAARYFMAQTQNSFSRAFADLFATQPSLALQSLACCAIYQKDILAKMTDLSTRNDPELYLRCFSDLATFDNLSQDASFQSSLADLTIPAIGKMLDAGGGLDFFTRPVNSRIPAQYQGVIGFQGYLPDQGARQKFVRANLEAIQMAFHSVAPVAHAGHFRELNSLCQAFPANEVPEGLADLKRWMLAERVKTCFRLAAEDPYNYMEEVLGLLVSEEKALQQQGCYRATQPDELKFRIICLSNPTEPPEAGDQDHGEDSKYLWIIEGDGDVLATSFTAASLGEYIKCQRTIESYSLPTTEELKQFADAILSPQPFTA